MAFQKKVPFANSNSLLPKFPVLAFKFPFRQISRFEFQAKFPFRHFSRFKLKRELTALGNLARASIKSLRQRINPKEHRTRPEAKKGI